MSLLVAAIFFALLVIDPMARLSAAPSRETRSDVQRRETSRIPLEATPKPQALPAGKAALEGVRTPEPADETFSRLLRMRSRLRNLQVDTQWIEGEEITRQFSATMGRGKLVGEGYINWSQPGTGHWAKVKVIEADVAEILHVCDVRFDGRIDSRVSGDLNLEWSGLRFRQMRQSMKGKGKLIMGEGRVSSTRLLDNIAKFAGLPELRTLRFRRGLVEGSIADGKVLVRAFELEGEDFRLRGEGTVTLETGGMDARFRLKVRPALAMRSQSPQVRAVGKAATRLMGSADKLVEVPLPISFGGTLERPIPYLDVPAMRALQLGMELLDSLTTASAPSHKSIR